MSTREAEQHCEFWKASGPNGQLSNFHLATISLEPLRRLEGVFFRSSPLMTFLEQHGDRLCNSAEHVFMLIKAAQFEDWAAAKWILNCHTPDEAKKAGRQVRNYDDQVWSAVRGTAVRVALLLKFGYNLGLSNSLQETKPAQLREVSPYDKI
jgi:ribA/ribD-fused uncharacterized protein